MGPAGHLHQNALPELPAALAECPDSGLQDAFGFHFINFATHKWAQGWPQNLSLTSVLMGEKRDNVVEETGIDVASILLSSILL